MIFPDQSIPQSEKDKTWFISHHPYADKLWAKNEKRLSRINKAYNAYHGKYSVAKSKEWTDRYKQGDANLSKAKFKHYKLASTKLERLHGEFISRVFKPVVETTGKDNLSEKMKNIGHQLAMKEMAPIINQFKESMGIDFSGGVPQVDLDDPEQVKMLNPKIEYEKYMSLVVKEQVERLRVKDIGADTILDCLISSECHATAYIMPNKKVHAERIHPRNTIFEEIENDDYLEDTSIYGYRVEMSQQDILRNYGSKMTKDERGQIRELNNHPEAWSSGGTEYYWENSNELVGWVQHLTWKSQKEIYEKVIDSKDNEFIDYYENILSTEYYRDNKSQIDRESKAGKYKIRKGYLTTIYESIRIGGNIYLNQREVPFIITKADDEEVFYNQTGLLFNTVNSKRLSLQEKLYDLDELYDVIMWQIRRELGKHTGSVTYIDKKFFDETTTENDILFNVKEEGVVVIDTSDEAVQANPGQSQPISSSTLGSMDTLNQLLQMKMDIERMVDRISGINEYMEGTAPVSATATQNVQAQEAGRTITSPIFYYHNIFMENLIFRIMELTKYAIGYLGDDSFDEILGDNGISIIEKVKDIELQDFGVYIPDPNKEVEKRKRLEFWSTTGINSRELSTHIAMQADAAETTQEAAKIISDGFKLAEETRKAEQQATLESQERNVKATNEAQKAMMEDGQQHDKDVIVLEGIVKGEEGAREAKNQVILDQRKEEAKAKAQQSQQAQKK